MGFSEVGYAVGKTVGVPDGACEGQEVGAAEGGNDGACEGQERGVGATVNVFVGFGERRFRVGRIDGEIFGSKVGLRVFFRFVGRFEGENVGLRGHSGN